jgi:rod shape-determining protein MreC
MRNFIKFLIQHHATLIFLGLEGICMFWFLGQNPYQQASVLNASSSIVGSIDSRASNFEDYLSLSGQNDSLSQVIADLRSELASARRVDSLNEYCFEDSIIHQVYTFLPAKVVRNEVYQRNNTMTINRGLAHGIREDMGVIGPDGIVGKVIKCSKNYSIVMSVLHSKFSASGQLPRAETYGQLQWNGQSRQHLQLGNIASHIQAALGDTVYTTGFSELFPEGLVVGQVDQIRNIDESALLELDIRLSQEMSSLRHVYVVNYLYKEERAELEAGNTGTN